MYFSKALGLTILLVCAVHIFFAQSGASAERVNAFTTQQVQSNLHNVKSSFDSLTWTSRVDPFDFHNSATFQQRYLFEQSAIPNTPLFVYTGGEANIEYYHLHSGGSFYDIARTFNASILILEHRYYGQSMPQTDGRVDYLSVDAAMHDFAEIIKFYRAKLNPSAVITGGGSYAGMLSAYMRVRYPHLVSVAVASSAPFSMIGVGDQNDPRYFGKITKVYQAADPNCPQTIRRAFNALNAYASQPGGAAQVQQDLGLCSAPETQQDFDWIAKWIRQGFTDISQGNYPNDDPKLSFPVNSTCKILVSSTNDADALPVVGKALNVAYPGVDCHDYKTEYFPCVDTSGCGERSPDGLSWDYQACTQLSYFPASNGGNADMFFPMPDNLTRHDEYCRAAWNVTASDFAQSLSTDFPSIDNWEAATTRVIFTNGQLDPWCPGGVKGSQGFWNPAFIIPQASHHADLNTFTQNDPVMFWFARDMIIQLITQFIKPQPDIDQLNRIYSRMNQLFDESCYP